MQRPTKYSAASSARTNPLRSNNDRDRSDSSMTLGNTASSSTERSSGDASGSEEASQTLDDRLAEDRRNKQKLNQIVQQFFLKGALVIVGSRVHFDAWYKNDQLKQNRWFNVVLNDAEELFGQLLDWRNLDVFAARPAPLTIETYIDLSDLTPGQTLVIIDSKGSRWDVSEALNPHQTYTARSPVSQRQTVVLERWSIELGEAHSVIASEAVFDLPNAYKKAVVLFRSLFTFTRTLPAWKYFRRIGKVSPNSASLKIKHRIFDDYASSGNVDLLEIPLASEPGPVSNRYVFEPSLSPAGSFCISVAYRDNCDFRVDDSESLLSSQFMASDDQYFQPSLSARQQPRNVHDVVPGSLPAQRRHVGEVSDQTQAYGSLSTFHGQGVSGTSPITALRNVQWPGVDTSPTNSPTEAAAPGPKARSISRVPLRSDNGSAPQYQRRSSVSFQAFKAGSLASSPASGTHAPAPHSPSTSSLSRDRAGSRGILVPGSPITSLPYHRSRTSVTTLPQHVLRAPASFSNETTVASSASGSPKQAPISRYSSSFSNRRNRFSSTSAGIAIGSGGSNSRLDDNDGLGGNNSSGKVSVSSSLRADTSTPEFGATAAGTTAGASSGSIQEADENSLQAFLKLLENKKELKSFTRTDSIAKEANITRTTAALGKYQRMRDGNAALSDSLSSSLLLHRSSSSSSRQLGAVPSMVADRGGSLESSSPGKPISPHTPHTPAIPSRLSAGAIYSADAGEVRRSRSGARTSQSNQSREPRNAEVRLESLELNRQTSDAIPIPTSPTARTWAYTRRSSSAAQQHRQAIIDSDVEELYGMGGPRSNSFPTEEGRGEIGMNELLRLTAEPSAMIRTGPATVSQERSAAVYGPSDDTSEVSNYRAQPSSHGGSGSSGSTRWRVRATGAGVTNLNTAADTGGPKPNRYSFGQRPRRGEDEDDEPLLFAMSEIGGSSSRRSLEEARGAQGSAGPSARPRGNAAADARTLGGDW